MRCQACEFKNKKEIIYETSYWRITLAKDQAYLGRCYIDLKRHGSSLSNLTKEEWLDFMELVKKIEAAIKKAFGAELFNWGCLMNDAYKNNPPNPHVHWHLRPRYREKIEFSGLIFEDKEFGHHYSRERKQEVSKEISEKIIEKIKENL